MRTNARGPHGLLTIVWRKSWETTGNPELKASLLQYNQEDCRNLKHVCELIRRLTRPNHTEPAIHLKSSQKIIAQKRCSKNDHIGTCLDRRITHPMISNMSPNVHTSITSARRCLCELIVSSGAINKKHRRLKQTRPAQTDG